MDGIRFAHTRILLDIVAASDTLADGVIRALYTSRALEYDKTLQFLTALTILRPAGQRIRRGTHFDGAVRALATDSSQYAIFLIHRALESSSTYGTEICALLLMFSVHGSDLLMHPLLSNDSRYAARNTLLAAGVLHLDHHTGMCTLPADYHGLHGQALCRRGVTSELLRERDSRNADLGHQAELSVLEYERCAVGLQYADQVVHVAPHNAGAGFDIASLRVEDGLVSQVRMIEVKAVSPRDCAFFFTASEVAAARDNGDAYFLYLVPVRNGKPVILELVTIRNPAHSVIGNACAWDVVPSTFYCKKRLDYGSTVL